MMKSYITQENNKKYGIAFVFLGFNLEGERIHIL